LRRRPKPCPSQKSKKEVEMGGGGRTNFLEMSELRGKGHPAAKTGREEMCRRSEGILRMGGRYLKQGNRREGESAEKKTRMKHGSEIEKCNRKDRVWNSR